MTISTSPGDTPDLAAQVTAALKARYPLATPTQRAAYRKGWSDALAALSSLPIAQVAALLGGSVDPLSEHNTHSRVLSPWVPDSREA